MIDWIGSFLIYVIELHAKCEAQKVASEEAMEAAHVRFKDEKRTLCQEFAAQRQELQRTIQSKSALLARQEENFKELQRQLDERVTEVQELQEARTVLQAKADGLEDVLAALRRENSELRHEHENLRRSAAQLSSALETSQSQLQSAESIVGSLEQELQCGDEAADAAPVERKISISCGTNTDPVEVSTPRRDCAHHSSPAVEDSTESSNRPSDGVAKHTTDEPMEKLPADAVGKEGVGVQGVGVEGAETAEEDVDGPMDPKEIRSVLRRLSKQYGRKVVLAQADAEGAQGGSSDGDCDGERDDEEDGDLGDGDEGDESISKVPAPMFSKMAKTMRQSTFFDRDYEKVKIQTPKSEESYRFLLSRLKEEDKKFKFLVANLGVERNAIRRDMQKFGEMFNIAKEQIALEIAAQSSKLSGASGCGGGGHLLGALEGEILRRLEAYGLDPAQLTADKLPLLDGRNLVRLARALDCPAVAEQLSAPAKGKGMGNGLGGGRTLSAVLKDLPMYADLEEDSGADEGSQPMTGQQRLLAARMKNAEAEEKMALRRVRRK